MYIKVRPAERMQLYTSTNERQFNQIFNKLVGSQGVTYANAFPMKVRNGKEYFHDQRNELARKYAGVLLYGGSSKGSSLAPKYSYAHMSEPQRAALSYLSEADDATVASALQRCDQVRAIPRSAVLLFGESHPVNLQQADATNFHSKKTVSLKQRNTVQKMQIDQSTAVHNTPKRSGDATIVLNAPASASHSLSLKPAGKRSRKNK